MLLMSGFQPNGCPPSSSALCQFQAKTLYIFVFKQPVTTQNGNTVTFAGVLDADGNPIDQARFNMDWRN